METGSFIVITTGNPGMRLWTLGDFEPLIVTWSLVQMLPPAFLWVLSASLWTQHCGWRPDLSQCPCLETFLKWEVAGILGSSMGLRVRNLSLTLYLSSSSAQQRCRTVWPWIMVQDLESFSRTNSLFCLSHGRIILDSDQFPWKKKKKKRIPWRHFYWSNTVCLEKGWERYQAIISTLILPDEQSASLGLWF